MTKLEEKTRAAEIAWDDFVNLPCDHTYTEWADAVFEAEEELRMRLHQLNVERQAAICGRTYQFPPKGISVIGGAK